MKATKDELKNLIRQYITQYTKAVINDNNKNLFCGDYHILLPDLLYVFCALEKRLEVSVAKILEQRNYTVFTVNNLTDAIIEDFPEILQ